MYARVLTPCWILLFIYVYIYYNIVHIFQVSTTGSSNIVISNVIAGRYDFHSIFGRPIA